MTDLINSFPFSPQPDRNQFGVTVKPIPRPRSKFKSKDEFSPTNTTYGSADTANNTTTSQVRGDTW